MGKKKNKSVRFTYTPGTAVKAPRSFLKPLDNKFIWAFRCDKVDWEHPYYGFCVKRIPQFIRSIKPKLDNYATMKWAEITAKESCHYMDTSRLSKGLISRIIELFGENGPETLYQIRLDGTHRVWGYREDNIFYVMFNDPEHLGYPVGKKHT
ncbi:hypothetical protein [Candidatus Avelusimicrobium alvi]|uniref:hypothetical protein n=1 Tax=Candidatus Avelusimicrobium alvi TaxID=3416221 RepID=UPI003D135959